METNEGEEPPPKRSCGEHKLMEQLEDVVIPISKFKMKFTRIWQRTKQVRILLLSGWPTVPGIPSCQKES